MSSITNAEFPMDEQGRTYHVGAKLGQSNLLKRLNRG